MVDRSDFSSVGSMFDTRSAVSAATKKLCRRFVDGSAGRQGRQTTGHTVQIALAYRRLMSASPTYTLACVREVSVLCTFSALTLLAGRREEHLACKKLEWWGAGVVICLEQGADLHTAKLMPLPLTVSCFSKIQIGFTFLVPAHPGSCSVL